MFANFPSVEEGVNVGSWSDLIILSNEMFSSSTVSGRACVVFYFSLPLPFFFLFFLFPLFLL
jgi:hypothetical protein